MPPRATPELLRYSAGIALPAAAAGLCVLFGDPPDPSVTFAIHALAVFGAAWFGGIGPGAIAAILSTVLRARFPSVSLPEILEHDLVGALFFGATALGLAFVARRLRRAQVPPGGRAVPERANPPAAPAPPEQRLQSILDACEARLFHLDRDLRLTWANRALRERHGIADGAGADLATLFEPQKRAALMRPLQRALEGHGEAVEWRALDARGESCWTFTMITPDFDERGAVRGCVVLCLDATPQHRADAARRRSEDQKRGMLENLPDLVWMAAADGTCEWFNHRWAAYTGRSVADWRDAVAPEDAERAHADWAVSLAQGKPLGIEVRLRRHDDALRWHLVRAQPLRESVTDDAIWGWSGSCTDIDDQKRAAALLHTTQQRISAFLGTLSHELRNPLAAVSAAVQVLRHPRAVPEMTGRALETLDRQAALLSRMVDDLLDAARLMDGRIDLQRRCVALNELLHEVCADLSARANEKGVRLHCEVPERRILVDADLLRIKQAVENVVINALQACAAGETVTVRVIDGRPGEIGIRVSDTGCGLSAERLNALFEPGSTPDIDKALGLGLGLKTVHRIMQLHGGRVVAHSDGEGKGATFDLFFPLFEAGAAGEASASGAAEKSLLAGPRILIVSNASAEIDPLLAPLENCAAEVRWATQGFEGLRIAAAWPPTALVCDLELPSPLSGFEVIRQIVSLPPERRPRLVAIGDEESVDVARAKAAGFDDCLIRPISLPRLLGTLAQAPPRAAAPA
jgi:signal transduction histidine kinase/CheY-like chemotaxis protein